MISVVIVDDDKDAALALKRNIDGMDDIKVVGIYHNGREAATLCFDKNPEVILMDVKMPVMDGIEASKLIKKRNPKIKILILTLFSEKESMINAIKANCDGFLFKGHRSEEILSVIKNTFQGLHTFENDVQSVFHEHIFNSNYNRSINEVDLKALNLLTKREEDIVRLITDGKKDSEIAGKLFISEGYLRNILVELREKLGLRNSKELAVWGAKMGL